MSEQRAERGASLDGITDIASLHARTMHVCPGCGHELGPRTCHMTYSTWRCWGCGALLDGRVVYPKLVLRCVNEWPDYEPQFNEPKHPLACSCTGRGWYPLDPPDASQPDGVDPR